MKKLLSFFLIALIVFVSSFGASAASSGRIYADEVSGKPGEEIEINIVVSDNPGIIAMLLHISYDKSELELTEVKNGEIFQQSKATFGNDIKSIPYNLMWDDGLSSVNNTSTGTLATLKFKIAETASSGRKTVKVEVDKNSTFDKDLANVSFSSENASINVTAEKEQSIFARIWRWIVAAVKYVFNMVYSIIKE